MKFTFELYRATSKVKSIPRKEKLMLNSNDRLVPMAKATAVDKLKDKAAAEVINSFPDIPKIHALIKTKKRNGDIKIKNIIKLMSPMFDNRKPVGVTVTVYSPTNKRCDPDNFQPTAKALMDGFTESGFWTDDNHEVVRFTKYQYGGLSGCKAYRLEVDVEEVLL